MPGEQRVTSRAVEDELDAIVQGIVESSEPGACSWRDRVRANLVITGAAGAGKTRAASAYAEKLYAAGVVSSPVVRYVDRGGLIGVNGRHTVDRTRGALLAAKNGVLVVDAPGDLGRPGDPAGATALETLYRWMSVEPGHPAVVLTDYPQPMAQLFAAHGRLVPRFLNRVEIPQPTSLLMWEAFSAHLTEMHLVTEPGVEALFRGAIDDLATTRTDDGRNRLDAAGNFRLARSVADAAARHRAAQALRSPARVVDLKEVERLWREELTLVRVDDVRAAIAERAWTSR